MNRNSFNDPRFERLKWTISEGNYVAFIGSGLSSIVYGDWTCLVNYLCEKCGVPNRVSDFDSPDKYLDAAQAARDADVDKYHEALGEKFGCISTTNPLYNVLMGLPFQSYVTVNLDPLLAYEAQKRELNCHIDMYPSLDAKHIGDNNGHRAIFYIHGLIKEGCVPKQGEVVLSRTEFDEAYEGRTKENGKKEKRGTLASFLEQLFTFNPICFIGCELGEPPLRRVLEECSDIQSSLLANGGPVPHKVILLSERTTAWTTKTDATVTRNRAEEEIAESKEDQEYQKMGIEVFRYIPGDQSRSHLRYFFEDIAKMHKNMPIRAGLSPKGAIYE